MHIIQSLEPGLQMEMGKTVREGQIIRSEYHTHTNYVKWKDLEVKDNLASMTKIRKSKRNSVREKYLDVTLFLAERNLPFRGTSSRFGEPGNSNYISSVPIIQH